ncbi:phospholipase A [Massilia sp. CF038]|uniref:phospholipase A n=1 Tax=Massilia sp. CF038 TaxID=1881045 RepID=UPI0009214191|nr:phospholipase A [Massilia sp. CF038]SHH71760.1 phospholipase A1 [Massilia sp. CF038]
MHAAAPRILFTALTLATAFAQAGELENQLLRCSALGDASARLGCFDELTKAATAATVAGAPIPDANAAAPAPIPPVASATKAPPETPISRTEQSWELVPSARRGVFSFRPHHENYLLLANYSNQSNTEPYRSQTPAGLAPKRVELTYQLSFKVKAAEQVAGLPFDIWLGYTQQSFWQAYNRAASSPFRETNYQPEVMAVMPINKELAGVNVRYLNLGLVHQSNGQTGTLSRSWNRLYAELGVDRGNFALSTRVWRRLDNAKSDNDNPDITDFMGHGDISAVYRDNGYEYSLMGRRNFSTNHGFLQAGWAYPITTNLKGYVQLSAGYGQSLIDYNYSQKSIGAGFNADF